MNQGLAILMERIDTNPEEFYQYSSPTTGLGGVTHTSSRWSAVILMALDEQRSGDFITPEERAELRRKLGVVSGDAFHKHVLRKLMEDQSGDDSTDHAQTNDPKYGARLGLSKPQLTPHRSQLATHVSTFLDNWKA